MDGTILNFRRSRHRTYSNQMIVSADFESKEEAEKLVGKKVVWNTGKRNIVGEIRSAHGNKGALRVLFETGMPGQAIGQKVKIS